MKASILTANYNCGPWIKQCAQSLFSQTYSDWEWIVVDDVSSDKSVSFLKRMARKHDNVKLIRNRKRLKCGSSYSIALSHAEGEICCVLDADDALASKKSLSILMNLYEKHTDIDYIWTQFSFCDPKLRVVKKGSCRCPKTSFLQAGVDYTKDRHAFSHWRTFRTSLRDKHDNIFKPGLPSAVDKWMAYALEEVGAGGFYNKVLYYYRQRLNGLSYTGRKHWKVMLREISANRKEKAITPIPTREIR